MISKIQATQAPGMSEIEKKIFIMDKIAWMGMTKEQAEFEWRKQYDLDFIFENIILGIDTKNAKYEPTDCKIGVQIMSPNNANGIAAF